MPSSISPVSSCNVPWLCSLAPVGVPLRLPCSLFSPRFTWAFTMPLAELDLENKKKQNRLQKSPIPKKQTKKIRCAVKSDFQINNKSFFSVSMSPAIFRT